MKARHASVSVSLAIVVALAAACGERDAPSPARPHLPSPDGLRPAPGRAPELPAVRKLQVTTIVVLYRTPRHPEVSRHRSQALVLARSLVARIREGESMERLLAEHTDDRDEDGRPFNGGTYSLLAEGDAAQPGLVKVAKSTPVGAVAPEPYDAGNAFVVLRRDA